MLCTEPMEDAGAVQEVVYERVDGDHGATGFDPGLVASRRRQQDARQGHGQDLVGHAIDVPQRLDEGRR